MNIFLARRLTCAIVLLLAALFTSQVRSQRAEDPPPDSIVVKPVMTYQPVCPASCYPRHIKAVMGYPGNQYWYGAWHDSLESAFDEAAQNFKSHDEWPEPWVRGLVVSEGSNLRLEQIIYPEGYWHCFWWQFPGRSCIDGADGTRLRYTHVLYDSQYQYTDDRGVFRTQHTENNRIFIIVIRPVCPRGFVYGNDPSGPQEMPRNSVGEYLWGYPNAGLCFRKLGDQLGDYCPVTAGSNPIDVSNGAKLHEFFDSSSVGGLFAKSYNSKRGGSNGFIRLVDWSAAAQTHAPYRQSLQLGSGELAGSLTLSWEPVTPPEAVGKFDIIDQDGSVVRVTLNAAPDLRNRFALQATSTGYRATRVRTGDIYDFDAAGRVLAASQNNTSRTWRFTYLDAAGAKYPDTAPECAATLPAAASMDRYAHTPRCVTDPFGRQTHFLIGDSGEVEQVLHPDGSATTFTYDAGGKVASSISPSGFAKTFHYDQGLLTGITDEHGSRYATYTYDSAGKAVSSEHAGGVHKYVMSAGAWGSQDVTDPLGTKRRYAFTDVMGIRMLRNVSAPCPSCSGNATSWIDYDAKGNVVSREDFNGNKTCYAYESTRNLETARVEGLGSSANCSTELAKAVSSFVAPGQRKVETTWHPTYRLITRVVEPAAGPIVSGLVPTKVTEYAYDTAGNLLTHRITAPKNDGSNSTQSRTWTYAYNAQGQVISARSPTGRITTTAYYTATDSGTPPKYTIGDVQSITNPAGQITTFDAYDRAGRLTRMTDMNGLVTTLTYEPSGLLRSRAVFNGTTTETTTYTYDKTGQPTHVTMPDNTNIYFAYDAAHRLVGTSDGLIGTTTEVAMVTMLPPGGASYDVAVRSLKVAPENLSGNRILYTLDNMGNRIKEEHFDARGTLTKRRQRVIDALNNLKQDIGGTAYELAAPTGAPVVDASVSGAPLNAAISEYAYDKNGNLTSTRDALGRLTSRTYDALNRITKTIDPLNGSTAPTTYRYDQADNLVSVTDPQGFVTAYEYNGHNELIRERSPDTGDTQYRYNAVGNVIAKFDSMGRCTRTEYDGLERVKTVRFYSANRTETNTQVGCFGTVVATIPTEDMHVYRYDSNTGTLGGAGGKGRVVRISDSAGNVDYVYDKNGRLIRQSTVHAGTTNPGRAVTYQYSANGQLRSMTTPSGQILAYVYGAPGTDSASMLVGVMLNPIRIRALADGGSSPEGGVSILTNARHLPFGPVHAWDWGNHDTVLAPNQHLRGYDMDYRTTFIDNDEQGYSRDIKWDRADRVTAITVPAGLRVPSVTNAMSLNQAFDYDLLDRLVQFKAGKAGATTASTGKGLLPDERFTYDAIGNRLSRVAVLPGTIISRVADYRYDSVVGASGPMRPVLAAIAGDNTWTYSYDATGNRTKEGIDVSGPATTKLTSTYDAKNRLVQTQVDADPANFVSYRVNALGQRVQKIGSGTYAFDATKPSTYAFNVRFVYDEEGHLIGEYAPNGELISETVWFNGMPVAFLRPKGASSAAPLGIAGNTTGNPSNGALAENANNFGNNNTVNRVNVEVFYVHADHLGTPRVVTRSTVATGDNAPSSATPSGAGAANKSVWMWNSDPFGSSGTTGAGGWPNSAPNKNPQRVSGTAAQVGAATFEQNLRMPGQFEDRESSKHYNYFRDYDPIVGRYIQPDPIGLAGGMSLYNYVGGSPIDGTDPLGLYQMCHRDLRLPIPIARHCYAKFDDGSTLSFDPNGVLPDPDPNQRGTVCTTPREPEKDECIRKAMRRCKSKDYDFTAFNCCACVEQALKQCGTAIPPSSWPNWPINPGPQPGETGYNHEPIYGPNLGK